EHRGNGEIEVQRGSDRLHSAPSLSAKLRSAFDDRSHQSYATSASAAALQSASRRSQPLMNRGAFRNEARYISSALVSFSISAADDMALARPSVCGPITPSSVAPTARCSNRTAASIP